MPLGRSNFRDAAAPLTFTCDEPRRMLGYDECWDTWRVIVGEWAILGVILTATGFLLALGVTCHAVLWKRDSRSVIGWVGLAWLAPFVGSLAYLLLGINRIQRKAASLDLHKHLDHVHPLELTDGEREQARRVCCDYPELAGLAQVGYALTKLPLPPGNLVQTLVDGDEAYPAMLKAIENSQRSVGLVSYLFDNDRAGNAFLDALLAAHRRGVEVRVLIDGVGARYSRPNMVRQLRRCGVPAASFLPTRTPRLFKYANLRNHRKILVVDGQIGFTGGTNIREGHWLKLKPSQPVQCLHFQITGPVVTHLQMVFVNDWSCATGESLSGEAWFSPLVRTGSVWARGIEHGPDEHLEKLVDVIAAALAVACNRVRILTPYFLPQPSLIQALNVAALRGVEVEIYIPSECNIGLVQWASMAQMSQLLEKGCRVYLTDPPFDHTKLMIVDDAWALIGSTNWDPRSLRLNFEFNVECYDRQLAGTLSDMVDLRVRTARQLTLQEVLNQPFPVRLRNGLARLLTPYL